MNAYLSGLQTEGVVVLDDGIGQLIKRNIKYKSEIPIFPRVSREVSR